VLDSANTVAMITVLSFMSFPPCLSRAKATTSTFFRSSLAIFRIPRNRIGASEVEGTLADGLYSLAHPRAPGIFPP
jgi:hypothetical protein